MSLEWNRWLSKCATGRGQSIAMTGCVGVALIASLATPVAAAAPQTEIPRASRGAAMAVDAEDGRYRVRELCVGLDGIATIQVILSPSKIRAKRLAAGAKIADPSAPEGGLAGSCESMVSTLTDSDFGPGAYIAQGGFAESETAAAEYTLAESDFPVRIDLTEMLFATMGASQSTFTEWTWRVWQGNPSSGLNVASFSSPDDLPTITLPPGSTGMIVQVMIDPSDPEQLFIEPNSDNAFSVGYRIDEHHAQTQNPCFFEPPSCCNAFPTTDLTGLDFPTKNWIELVDCGIFGCGAGWKKFSQLGFCTPSGDWVMRATWTPVFCIPSIGACCFSNGDCDVIDQSLCDGLGGTFNGDGTTCAQADCLMTGACCFIDGTCETLSATACANAGGMYNGNDSSCATTVCPETPGPCCFESTGGCIQLKKTQCLNAGGLPGPAGVPCAGYVCFPKGACCLPDGTCQDDVSPTECAALDGAYQGNNTLCASVDCPDPVGACCFSTGFCLELGQLDCELTGATWSGQGTSCSDVDANGIPDGCEKRRSSPDLNNDGHVDGADLGILLGQWGGPGSADFNGDGVVNGADLGVMLGAWTG